MLQLVNLYFLVSSGTTLHMAAIDTQVSFYLTELPPFSMVSYFLFECIIKNYSQKSLNL